MTSFEDKIYTLNERLLAMESKPQKKTSQSQQIYNALELLQQEIEIRTTEMDKKFDRIMEQLQEQSMILNRVKSKSEMQVSEILQNIENHLENVNREKSQNEQNSEKEMKNTIFKIEQDLNNQKCEQDLRVKQLIKEIQREIALFQKTIASLSDNSNKGQSKIYKDYFAKLVKIEENQKRKIERIKQLQLKMQKKVGKIYQNMSERIITKQKQTRSKYEKLKRLFSLVTEIS